MSRSVRIILVIGLLLALAGPGVAAPAAKQATGKATTPDPATRQAVLCGQVDKSDPDFGTQQQIRDATGELPRVLVAAEYEGLEGGGHLCAGLFTSAAEAERLRIRLGKAGLSCTVKAVTPLSLTPRDIRYVGDHARMWFCFRSGGGELSSETCLKHFSTGRRLYQPVVMKNRQGLGHRLLNVLSAEPSGDICGGQTARYRATRLRHEEAVKAIGEGQTRTAIQERVAGIVQARTGKRIPSLVFEFIGQLDLTGDKTPDTLVWVRANDPRSPNPKADYLSMILVLDAAGDTVYDLFVHHVPARDLRGGLADSLMEGRLLGVLDADGDRRPDVAIEIAFGGSQGLRLVTLDRGEVRVLAQDLCNR